MRLTRDPWTIAVAALVTVSSIVHFAATHAFAAPWIAPDEMLYGLIGRSFWDTGHFELLGSAAPFYGLYPVVAGLPQSLFGIGAGITVLQAFQAVVASSVAAAVFTWARPLAGPRWAFVAAVGLVLLPALAYSGLVMTESVFLAAATLTLWLLARALEQPTRMRQLAVAGGLILAVGARMQGVVLIPIMVTSVVLAAWFARDGRLVRRFVPMLTAIAAVVLLWVAFRAISTGSLGSSLGAYRGAAGEGYDVTEAGRWVVRHAGDLFLLVIGAPLIAMLLLAWEAARGRERDPRVRALVAVALSTSAWLVVQVGIFASHYVGQLAERDLIAAVPPLLGCFAVWLSRGLPRPQPATSIIAGLAAVPALLLPVKALVTPTAAPDAFMTIPLSRLLERTSADTLETTWLAVAAGLLLLTAFIPRRAVVVLLGAMAATLIYSSVVTVREVEMRADRDRTSFFGDAPPSWVDEAAAGEVTYLYDGNPYWNGMWQTVYWNEHVRSVAALPETTARGLPSTTVSPRFDGTLFDLEGNPMRGDEVVASTAFTFMGDPVAAVQQSDADQGGLRLWRLAGEPRLSTWTTGLRPNGDIVQPVRVSVYACGQGRLALTLLGKQGLPIDIYVDGSLERRVQPRPEGFWQGSIPAPSYANGETKCVFELRSDGLAGSTQLEFVRDS